MCRIPLISLQSFSTQRRRGGPFASLDSTWVEASQCRGCPGALGDPIHHHRSSSAPTSNGSWTRPGGSLTVPPDVPARLMRPAASGGFSGGWPRAGCELAADCLQFSSRIATRKRWQSWRASPHPTHPVFAPRECRGFRVRLDLEQVEGMFLERGPGGQHRDVQAAPKRTVFRVIVARSVSKVRKRPHADLSRPLRLLHPEGRSGIHRRERAAVSKAAASSRIRQAG